MTFTKSQYLLSCCKLVPINDAAAKFLAHQMVLTPPWNKLSYSETSLSCYLTKKSSDFFCFAIKNNCDLIGVICLKYPWLKGAYIELLFILQNFQQKSLGTFLINWIENQLNITDNNNIWALVSEFNTNAIQFYIKNGFKKIGLVEDYIQQGSNEILIRKIL